MTAIEHAARVNRLLNAFPHLNGPHADTQHDLVVAAIMGSMESLHDRARIVVSFDTYAILREEPYLTSIFEALFTAHIEESDALFQDVKDILRRNAHQELWMVYPAMILALIRFGIWCDTYGRKHEKLIKMLPWYIGALVRDYVNSSDGDIPERQWCSKWALGHISNDLSVYLGPVPTEESIRRIREIIAIMDECDPRVHRPVHNLVSQFTHRAFSMIKMRAQIAILRKGLDEFGSALAVTEDRAA